MDRVIKFRYTIVRPNGHTFHRDFTLQDIEQGKVVDCFSANKVGGRDQIHRRQLTGPKDRNGKEMYDGDILHFVDPNNYSRPKVFTSVIQWFQEGCAWECSEIGGPTSRGLYIFDAPRMEVIGNRWENPELMEQNV